MSGVEALARVLCLRVTAPGYCDRCETAAEHVLADPGPLLEALAEAGVLREERASGSRALDGSLVDVRLRMPDGRRYVTEWRPVRDPQAWSVLAEGLDGEAGMKR